MPRSMCWSPIAVILALSSVASSRAQSGAEVKGNLAITEKRGKTATDVADAVVWLEGGGAARPRKAEIATEKKKFLPRVLVVTTGSSVSFPNHDPFNHNVFSLSDEDPFDLGLYGRGETRIAQFSKPGIVRVYCNVHAQMSAFVVVRDTEWFTQPAADGSFRIGPVPAGKYRLRAWHERGGETSQDLEVPAAGLANVALELDASGFKFKPHLNKFGKPYDNEGRRY